MDITSFDVLNNPMERNLGIGHRLAYLFNECRKRVLHDHFFREAKRNGYRSRAAYKLLEIDDKRDILEKERLRARFGCCTG